MHILIAPNAFKHSLSATEVAETICDGLKKSALQFEQECFPIGDGGDGTGELILKKMSGSVVDIEVSDPLGRKIKSWYGIIEEGRTAVIEMANASGLRLLNPNEMDPLKTSSFGTGEMIRDALDRGVNKIIVAMGVSATVDAGCGILSALGVCFLNGTKEQLPASPEHLLHLAHVDTSALDPRINDCEVIVLCDVDNPILGSNGAAPVFGPQKGALPAGVNKLEKFLDRFVILAMKHTKKNVMDLPAGGTAGGAAAGLYCFLDAKLVNGIDYYLNLTAFEKSLNRADLVITGEGSIDLQTLSGKGPFGVAVMAKEKDIPVIALAGKIPIKKNRKMQEYFDALFAIGNQPSDLTEAFKNAKPNLERTACEIGNLLSLKKCDFKSGQ